LAELVFVKLGGSLITDKNVEASASPEVIRRLAREVRRVRDSASDLRLVLGHGSGSFGHIVAQRYGVHRGCTDWYGYAYTSAAAARLNRLVADLFLEEGVPVVSLQPSASARCRRGELVELAWHPVEQLLQRGVVPLVYGDVALDEEWGSTIASTEIVFAHLARRLKPQRILLVGEVKGIYSADPHDDPSARLIARMCADELQAQTEGLSGSHGVDVTGGMRSKVLEMAALVREMPALRVVFLSGLEAGLLERALNDRRFNPGTVLAVA
jgi:isopentenyl phosphate kinase